MPKLNHITNRRKTSIKRNLFPQALCDTKITHFYGVGPVFNQKESLTVVEPRFGVGFDYSQVEYLYHESEFD